MYVNYTVNVHDVINLCGIVSKDNQFHDLGVKPQGHF